MNIVKVFKPSEILKVKAVSLSLLQAFPCINSCSDRLVERVIIGDSQNLTICRKMEAERNHELV